MNNEEHIVKHKLNMLEVSKIKYQFKINEFDYKLPIIGVDLEFLALRRGEIIGHMETLKAKVSTIDIITAAGWWEFTVASKMVDWYQIALREINTKEYMIGLDGKKYVPSDCSDAHKAYMYHATRERTI